MEVDQEVFEGFNPFEVKQKVIMLVQSATKKQFEQDKKRKDKELMLKVKELTGKREKLERGEGKDDAKVGEENVEEQDVEGPKKGEDVIP
ncbi:unnamed protein product [Lactuca virosa]|uniref:Uncharacterized protein n=1 Tax=Lactuca virosa TaxID=75947 RepID=A0AAU9MKY8_9ASTR|nr:unnamed protein product [Lactuca virosa]